MAEFKGIQHIQPKDLSGFVINGCDTDQALTLNHRIHGIEKNTFHCGICGLGFDMIRRLIFHTKIHKTEKPYKCDVCGKCFSKLFNHIQHMKIHTGEKPYQCDVCEKNFSVCTCIYAPHKQNNMETFKVGDSVKIDGKGHAIVTKVVLRGSCISYEVKAEMSIDRLTLIPEMATQQTNNNNARTRFPHVSENQITDFIQENTNKHTESKTFYDMKTLQSFFDEVNEKRKIYELPVSELSSLLCRFFISARKPDGSHYKPSTLRGMMASFDRQLRRYNYGHIINTSPELAQVRKVLASKQSMLKKEGIGNMTNKSDPIDDEEVNVFWSSGQFGGKSPNSIIQTLWFYNTVYFGLRGSAEHRDMRWGSISLHTDDNGVEYLSDERPTKIGTGLIEVKRKLWANPSNSQRCPVLIYKLYANKRPSDYSSTTDPFYLAPSARLFPGAEEQWFTRQPVGINKIGSIMSRMVRDSGIKTDKRLSNHSVRKYLVQKLNYNSIPAIPANQIMPISGHISSINNCSNINENQHKEISRILCSEASYDRSQIHATISPSQMNMSTPQSTASTSVSGFQSKMGVNIYGGNVSIHVHQVQNNTETNKPSPKRFCPAIESDSD